MAKLPSSEPGPAPAEADTKLKGTSVSVIHPIDNASSSSNQSAQDQTTFLTKGLEDAYVPIDTYEGRHRFDPNFQWTEQEEKKLVRKVRCFFLYVSLLDYTETYQDRSTYLQLGLLDVFRSSARPCQHCSGIS